MTILLFLCFCSVINSYKVHATLPIPRTEDLEIERHLKLLNKPPIRSIHMKFRQIVDCIDINKQPAFDLPLLKNHKLQRNPTFLHRRKRTKKNASPIRTSDFELEKVSCPLGSVPIRRTNKEDLIQMKYYLSSHTHILTQGSPGDHYVIYVGNIGVLINDFELHHSIKVTVLKAISGRPSVQSDIRSLPKVNTTYLELVHSMPRYATFYTKRRNDNSYYGVNAHIDIYNPRVKRHQLSLAQIAVQNGEGDGLNTITFGWQVAPELYTRKTTNVFALWTSDSFKTGCYNMLCRGFVQIDRNIFLGIRINPVSSYGGEPYELSFSISQDPNSRNWWLIINDIHVGYYPAELFSNLSVADQVGWGGRVCGTMGGISPQMGSGYFPDGDLTHACFMRRISYNVSGSLQEPQEDLLGISVDNPNCYNLTYLGFLDNDNRNTFQFGGPGGQCDT